MLSEEEVYNGTKRFLKKSGFTLLAGQPPRGVDHLPVVEIKSGTNITKGSKDAFKPDLVAFNDKSILIIECKPTFNLDDVNKLYEILDSELRLKAFYDALKERNLLKKIQESLSFDEFKNLVQGGISYGTTSSYENTSNNTYVSDLESSYTPPIYRLYQIIVSNWLGTGILINPKK